MIRRSFLPPTSFEFVPNLQTANTFGIKPARAARRCDGVIEAIDRNNA
jgi:hypothetical protein